MSDRSNKLLNEINEAVAAANKAEETVTTAQAELVSRSKTVGLLLLEAKKLHPVVKDFEVFLKRVHGLKLSRAYDYMRIAGGRATDEELRKDARERKQKSRAKDKTMPKPDPVLPKPKPEQKVFDSPQEAHAADSVTVTESEVRPSKAINIGSLVHAWHNVEEAAAAGHKSRLLSSLKWLKQQTSLAINSDIFKSKAEAA
jgi:hypothetical protein